MTSESGELAGTKTRSKTDASSLRERLGGVESIAELERAGLDRFDDSAALATRGRWHGAVYLLGYYVEITLKVIYFRCFGFHPDQPIRRKELAAASQLARESLRISDPWESFHNPVFWARAVIGVRDHLGLSTPAEVAQGLVWRAQRLWANWKVGMRYSRNVARMDDWTCVWEDAVWIKANVGVLAGTKGPIERT